jgi:hypothetical protein
MRESTFEDILAKYPDLIEDSLRLMGRQQRIHGRIMDLLFEDSFKRKLIIELKAGAITDQAIGQILSYEGMLLSGGDPTIRVMLIGTRVPPNIRKALDHHGIAWKEITANKLKEYLIEKNDQTFLPAIEDEESLPTSSTVARLATHPLKSQHVTQETSAMDGTEYPFERFIEWVRENLSEWKSFKTLGEIRRELEGKLLRGKTFIARYNKNRKTIQRRKPWFKEGEFTELKDDQLRRIYDRFLNANEHDRDMSSYYQIQKWPEAPDKHQTPAMPVLFLYWLSHTGSDLGRKYGSLTFLSEDNHEGATTQKT